MVFTLACALYVEGAFMYMHAGKNKFRLQYPGCGVLSNELWRTITDPFLGMIVFYLDPLWMLTPFYSVKFSGHL